MSLVGLISVCQLNFNVIISLSHHYKCSFHVAGHSLTDEHLMQQHLSDTGVATT